MAKKIERPRGPRKPPGETRKDIVSILLNLEREKPELNEYRTRDPEFKDGKWIIYPAWQSIPSFRIKERELIEIIKKELTLNDNQGISTHLRTLCKEGELIKYAKDNEGYLIRLSEHGKVQKNTTGNDNEWEIDQESFKKIAGRFLGKDDELMFLRSNYAKKWIDNNAFNEFITNFGIDLKVIQEIIESASNTSNEQRLSYLEILRNRITQIVTLSPSALKFILDTKVDTTDARIKAIAILNESSDEVNLLFDIKIKENIFFEKYGAKNFNPFPVSLNMSPGWTMLNYCEFSIKMLENDLLKDFFRYPGLVLDQTLPISISLGEHLMKILVRMQESFDIGLEKSLQKKAMD